MVGAQGQPVDIHPSDNRRVGSRAFQAFLLKPTIIGRATLQSRYLRVPTRHSNLGGSNQDHAELCVMVNSRESGLNIGQYPIRVLTFAKKRFFNYTGSLLSRSPISRKCEGLVPANQTFAN